MGENIKLTFEQKHTLLNFMVEHPLLSRGQLLGAGGRNMRSSLWAVLAEQLNSCGGPNKSITKWQRVSHIKETFRYLGKSTLTSMVSLIGR
ncbi:unnamed protein product [Acanthoscelides obtectus]|uniref:Regulatory protein zeste n=1 Tax=Acanthoscelides obtectus TaxID=200917 RepID=A0A9P0PRX2_ACAOB|nr:unnamed protein product [Acanthoscelides obtectus]CAK1633353.1 hypothetical protein AOBTE_LOCUS8067 [Acanthoscelides obtectus]